MTMTDEKEKTMFGLLYETFGRAPKTELRGRTLMVHHTGEPDFDAKVTALKTALVIENIKNLDRRRPLIAVDEVLAVRGDGAVQ